MTDRQTVDPLELFASLDPLPPERLDDLREREATFARIAARREGPPAPSRRIPRRRLVAVAVVALALAIPALAFSGALDSLFGFSNHGTPVEQDTGWIVGDVRSLTGETPGSVVQLASRDGWKFFEARTTNDACYFDEPPAGSMSDGIPNLRGGDCKNIAGDRDFPSPARPIFNMSHYLGVPPKMNVLTLAGLAADGVASVQVLAQGDCHVVATAPVIDNVYLAADLPLVPEAQVVARDARGNVIWHQAVGAAVAPAPRPNSCGLGE
jgi:hypothetical protein